MEQYNYDRRYSLSITSPERTFSTVVDDLGQGQFTPLQGSGELPTPFSFAYQPKEELISITNSTVTIDDLQFTADITDTNQTQGSDTGKATISIYNLSEETRSIIAKKDNTVILKAGYVTYEDELPIVFTGQVVRHSTKKQGQDVITTLECRSGESAISTARASIRVPAGSTYRDVFLALAGEMNKAGVATGKIVTDYGYLLGQDGVDITPNIGGLNKYLPPQDIVLFKGWSFSGKVSKALDDLCETFNHTWQIVDNRLFIHPKYYGDMIGTVTLDQTQILSIDDVEDGTQTGNNPAETTGIKVGMLLDGRIKKYHRLVIANGDKAGQYPIRSVTHKLDYEGQNWNTELECGGSGA